MQFGNLFLDNISRKSLKNSDDVVFVGMQDVDENATIQNYHELKYSEVKSGFTYFEKNDVLVAKITPCFENGKGGFADETPTDVGFGSTEFHVLRAKPNVVPQYVYYQTKRARFRNELEGDMVGSAGHRRVPLSSIQKFELETKHSFEEQTAIANALFDIDNLITSIEKLIEKKRAIKTATMQQLLTGKKRLPPFDKTHTGYKQTERGEIPKDWEIVNLGDIGQNIIGLTYSPDDVVEYGTLVLRSSNVQQNKLAFDNNVFVDMDLPDRVIVKENDILVCVRNGSKRLIGKCALIDKRTVGLAFGAFMSIYRSNFNKFIFFQFQSNIIQKQIDEIMGATINQITNKDMAVFKIPLPNREDEQVAIAIVLSDMDKDINSLGIRLNKTKQIKQGMMQELLTGRTRLV